MHLFCESNLGQPLLASPPPSVDVRVALDLDATGSGDGVGGLAAVLCEKGGRRISQGWRDRGRPSATQGTRRSVRGVHDGLGFETRSQGRERGRERPVRTDSTDERCTEIDLGCRGARDVTW